MIIDVWVMMMDYWDRGLIGLMIDFGYLVSDLINCFVYLLYIYD